MITWSYNNLEMIIIIYLAKSAEAVEYGNCIAEKG